jgi:hypothetical protein
MQDKNKFYITVYLPIKEEEGESFAAGQTLSLAKSKFIRQRNQLNGNKILRGALTIGTAGLLHSL